MSFDFAAFDAAVNTHYGFISGLLEKECGCRIVHGSPGDACVSLVCANHGNTPKNANGHYLHCNDQKGAWKCFKCENEGNHIASAGYAVEAIMEYKHMDRKEAFRYLAEQVNFQSKADYEYRDTDIRSLYVNACHELLMAHKSEAPYAEAYQYLVGRGFTEATIKKHRIGFVNGFAAVNALRKKGINDTQLERAGALNRSKKTGKLYPFFTHRVVMMTGYNIYGRAIDPQNTLRHLYTRDKNSIFNEMVLGREWDAVFVVEAAFDAMTIEQYIHELGANWCVIATCGTKGIKMNDLIETLKGVVPAEVILVPDADQWYENGHRHAAGQRAGLAKARALEAVGFRTRIVVLPDDSDPNDLSKKGVPSARFEAMVKRALTPAKFSIYCEAHYHVLHEHSGNVGFLNAVRKELIKYKIHLSAEIVDYLALLTGETSYDIQRYMFPSLKESDALDFVRSEVMRGKSLDQIFEEIRAKLVVQIPA